MKLQQRFSEVRKRKGLAESTEEAYWTYIACCQSMLKVFYGLLFWGLASHRSSIFHIWVDMRGRFCCARSLTRYANPHVSPAWIGVQKSRRFALWMVA